MTAAKLRFFDFFQNHRCDAAVLNNEEQNHRFSTLRARVCPKEDCPWKMSLVLETRAVDIEGCSVYSRPRCSHVDQGCSIFAVAMCTP